MKKTVYYAVVLSAVSIVVGLVAGVSLERANVRKKLCLMQQAPFAREAGPHKARTPQDVFKRIADELNLNEEQKGKVQEILEGARQKIALVGKESREKLQAVRKESNDGIAQILTPEQKVKFQKIIAEVQKRHQKLGHKFGGQLGQGLPKPGNLDESLPPSAELSDNPPAEAPQN